MTQSVDGGQLDLERLRAFGRQKPRTKAGQVRQAWPDIEKLLAAGHTLKDICRWLNEIGLEIGYARLSDYVSRLRRSGEPGTALGNRRGRGGFTTVILGLAVLGIQTVSAQNAPSRVLALSGVASELASISNGAQVVPSQTIPGIQGKLVVRGTGSVSFDQGGFAFGQGGQQNTNTAYLQFTGEGVAKLLDTNSPGGITFQWRSHYSFADRSALYTPTAKFNMRTAFSAYNDSGEQIRIEDHVADGRLAIIYKVGDSPAKYYYFPKGQEDALFGKDVVAKIALTWNGLGSAVLSINDSPVSQNTYVKPRASWRTGSFAIGARDMHEYNGGFYASDDVISGFQAFSSDLPPDLTPPTVKLLTPKDGQALSGFVTLLATAADNTRVATVNFAIDGVEFGWTTDYPYRYAWNTTGLTDGPHQLDVIAVDTGGNRTTQSVQIVLQNAVAAANDQTPPEPITGLRTILVTSTQISFWWDPAADNVATVSYNIFRDGSLLTTVPAIPGGQPVVQFDDSGLTPGTVYSYQVSAVDAVGNESPRSSPLALITKAQDGRTLTVGPNGMYAKPCAAIAAARPWDTIEIDNLGNYDGDVCYFKVDHLTLRGMRGRAHIDAAGFSSQNKAIWVIGGADNIVENMDMSGATVGDANGAPIRLEGRGLTLRNVYFHDNQMGFLAGNGLGGDILIEYSEFARNGFGDGRSHNLYIGDVDHFTIRYSYSHDCNGGHLVKSRGKENRVLYNRLTDENGTAGYEIDLSNAGLSWIIGNMMQKNTSATNGIFISYGMEGIDDAHGKQLYAVNNTFVSDLAPSWGFHEPDTTTVLLQNNLFSASRFTVFAGGAVQQVSNVVLAGVPFEDGSIYDYLPTYAAGVTGVGSLPSADVLGNPLTPAYQYIHPTSARERAPSSSADIGAFAGPR